MGNLALFLCTLLATLLALAQFGRRVSAAHALVWWIIFATLLACAARPSWFEPLADALGVHLVSNLVLAALAMLLLIQVFELQAAVTTGERRLRRSVSQQAVSDYLMRQRDRQRDPDMAPRVLVVAPCYQEQSNVTRFVAECQNLSEQHPDIRFVVVDDGSSDETPQLLESLAPGDHATHGANLNVSGVLLTGFRLAQRLNVEFVVQCDSDGQHPVDQIYELVELARQEHYDLLVGSRFVPGPHPAEKIDPRRRFGIWLLSQALRLACPQFRMHDPTSGFRVFSRRAAVLLSAHMPDEYPEPECVALCGRAGLKVGEHSVRMRARQGGVSSLTGFVQFRYMSKVFTALLAMCLRDRPK